MNSEITSETEFPEAIAAKNLQGSCAARNIKFSAPPGGLVGMGRPAPRLNIARSGKIE